MFDPTKLEALKQQKEKWNRKVEAKLAKAPERKKTFSHPFRNSAGPPILAGRICPTWIMNGTWGSPGNTLIPGGSSPPCTGAGSGPCASMPVSPRAEESNKRYQYLSGPGTDRPVRGL